MEETDTGTLGVAGGLIKALALLVGGIGTLVCLMSLIGMGVGNVWVGFGGGLLVALLLPALIVGKLLPEDVDKRPKGLFGDVYALSWMAFVLLFAVAGHAGTEGMLAKQGDRLNAAGIGPLGTVAYVLAGVDPKPTTTPPSLAAASASASTNASASANPPVEPSSTAATAKPTATAKAAPSASSKPPEKSDVLTPAALFKKWAPSVVTIRVKGAGGMMEGGGTGFLLDNRGTIATNSHVIARADSASIRFKEGATYKKITVLMNDGTADLALLQVQIAEPDKGEPPTATPVELGDSDGIVVGEVAISIGNPLGLDHTLTTGVVSARRKLRGRDWIQMETPISPGNSGGPVFNSRGEVVGVTTATLRGAQNLNLAVPINVLKGLMKLEYPGKHKLGEEGSTQW